MVDKIGSRIKTIRKQHGLTMSEFAKLIEVSAGNVGDWESDKKKTVPSAKALIKIANKFAVSLDWLMTGKETSQPDDQTSTLLSKGCALNSKLNNLNEDEKKFLEEFLHLYMEHRKKS